MEKTNRQDEYSLWREEALINMKGIFGDDVEKWFCHFERDMRPISYPAGQRSFIRVITELVEIAGRQRGDSHD